MTKEPILTIITVSLNSEKTIRRTLDSLLCQRFKEFEVVVIDGGSSDRTVEIIDNCASLFESAGIYYHWISERDSGIYDAMNKGVSLSKGKWIQFLNSDDFLLDEYSLLKISSLFDSVFEVIGAGVHEFSKEEFINKMLPPTRLSSFSHPPHNSSFVRRELYLKYPFNLKFRICADRDVFMKLYKLKIKYVSVPEVIVGFSIEGVSSTMLIPTWREVAEVYRLNNMLFEYFIWRVMFCYKVMSLKHPWLKNVKSVFYNSKRYITKD